MPLLRIVTSGPQAKVSQSSGVDLRDEWLIFSGEPAEGRSGLSIDLPICSYDPKTIEVPVVPKRPAGEGRRKYNTLDVIDLDRAIQGNRDCLSIVVDPAPQPVDVRCGLARPVLEIDRCMHVVVSTPQVVASGTEFKKQFANAAVAPGLRRYDVWGRHRTVFAINEVRHPIGVWVFNVPVAGIIG